MLELAVRVGLVGFGVVRRGRGVVLAGLAVLVVLVPVLVPVVWVPPLRMGEEGLEQPEHRPA